MIRDRCCSDIAARYRSIKHKSAEMYDVWSKTRSRDVKEQHDDESPPIEYNNGMGAYRSSRPTYFQFYEKNVG